MARHRIQAIQRDQFALLQAIQRRRHPADCTGQRHVGRQAPGLLRAGTHRQRLVGLARARRTFQIDPVVAGTHRDRAQLRQRAVRRADEGLQALVPRVMQGQRKLRHTNHFGSGPFS